FAEEGVSTRAIIREFLALAKESYPADIMPKDIATIAKNEQHIDSDAAKKSFEMFGRCLGDSLQNLVCLTDSIIVIGGGIMGAAELFMPAVLQQTAWYKRFSILIKKTKWQCLYRINPKKLLFGEQISL
ncbi:MAG: hypothetical protein CSB03_00710, partial [Bacteroidia bacterium]